MLALLTATYTDADEWCTVVITRQLLRTDAPALMPNSLDLSSAVPQFTNQVTPAAAISNVQYPEQVLTLDWLHVLIRITSISTLHQLLFMRSSLRTDLRPPLLCLVVFVLCNDLPCFQIVAQTLVTHLEYIACLCTSEAFSLDEFYRWLLFFLLLLLRLFCLSVCVAQGTNMRRGCLAGIRVLIALLAQGLVDEGQFGDAPVSGAKCPVVQT